MSYPYPGFSWSITQHVAPAAQSKVIFELLNAAYIFSDRKTYRSDITDYMIKLGLLTPNIRQDQQKPELWRDYQQILPELGLIVSTRFTEGVSVTPIGLLWLDGIIGYSELITTQIFKYQYPNGHKQDISPNIKSQLAQSAWAIPQNRVVLDTTAGVMIKPAVLILRVLLTLIKEKGHNKGLTPNEIALALMPIKKNEEWRVAVSNLERLKPNSKSDVRRIRHIQEWVRLLSLSDIFEIENGKEQRVKINSLYLSNLKTLEDICDYHENISTFWIPKTNNAEELGLDWFKFFGASDIESQWLLEEDMKNIQYIAENYPEGEFEDTQQISNEDVVVKDFNLLLKEYQSKNKSNIYFTEPQQIDIQKVIEGRKKIFDKTKLHDEIVKLLADKLILNGFKVYEDRKSVDLLAVNQNEEFIFEVKTINKNNVFKYFRLGIGQLSEYRFRRQQQSTVRPKGILVLSSAYNFPNWAVDFMNTDINLGLISLDKGNAFKNYTTGHIEKIISS